MSSLSMPARSLVAVLTLVLLGAGLPLALAADEPGQRTEKWYEQTLQGNKTGYLRVVWAPSTWEGRKTVRDTTTVVNRTLRNMAGMKDTFEVSTTVELERGTDGTLWWMRVRTEEAGRITVRETKWTGKGYVYSEGIVKDGETENPRTIEVSLEKPVRVDAEAFLASRARAGTLKKGDTFDLTHLDLRKRGIRITKLEILGPETLKDESGEDIATIKFVERDPDAGTESTLWIDRTGAFVKLRSGAVQVSRTTQGAAEKMPVRPAEYSITVGASPRLERIFNADRVLIDVHVQPDAERKIPKFPESPWSRAIEVTGDEKDGHLIKVELRRHDSTKKTAKIPLVDKSFERWLEPTALMQTQDPEVLKKVQEVVGEETDARKAAHKLARFVFTELRKRSPKMSQADAVQILKDCEGDCSEHALLFVTMCRAAGIPARSCSGFVCIGGMWGSHAWAEIWTGQWIGADPTTGEVGTAARYLFYGYPEEPGSFPGVVSSRARGRLRIVTTRLEEGKAAFDLTNQNHYRIYDRENRRYLNVLAGLEARDVPDDWTVELSGGRLMRVRGPGFQAQLSASADQGSDLDSVGKYYQGRRTTFAGAPAILRKSGTTRLYLIFSRRRMVQMYVGGLQDKVDEALAELERVLAPTFAEPAPAWEEKIPPGKAEPKRAGEKKPDAPEKPEDGGSDGGK